MAGHTTTYPQQTEQALATLIQLRAAKDGNAAWAALLAYADTIDADLLAYHHHAPDFAPDHENLQIRTRGFPDNWVKAYIAENLHRIDPIVRAKDIRVRPVQWSQIETVLKLSPEQSSYMQRLREWMTGDGLGLPTYGPSGRAGYVGVGRATRNITDWDAAQLARLQWIAQSFHLRMCELAIQNLPNDFSLSERELTILKSMAMGMSDSIICGVVGARLHSVESSIQRIQKKMSVSDRPSAILRAIGAGLLDPSEIGVEGL